MQYADVDREGIENPIPRLEPIQRDPGVVVEQLGDRVVVRVVRRPQRRPKRIDILVTPAAQVGLDADQFGGANAVSCR